ncbi:MAG: hypothetical protein L0Z48_03435 [candidate division Zixibacteria bacterium]|nr:hypothetical protein [candidate division Zixibacteria bacterium]MCI0595578.1 hypothetical protein [candidate division Zixibacteria bacterium]
MLSVFLSVYGQLEINGSHPRCDKKSAEKQDETHGNVDDRQDDQRSDNLCGTAREPALNQFDNVMHRFSFLFSVRQSSTDG